MGRLGQLLSRPPQTFPGSLRIVQDERLVQTFQVCLRPLELTQGNDLSPDILVFVYKDRGGISLWVPLDAQIGPDFAEFNVSILHGQSPPQLT
jgi:hypothetical protein